MEASAEGTRGLWISLAVLAVTALIQLAVVLISGSVALLGDTLHNAADALTAVPLGIAFVAGRRPPNRRYTCGHGRAEDLAGVVIVLTSPPPPRWRPMRRSPGSPTPGRSPTWPRWRSRQ